VHKPGDGGWPTIRYFNKETGVNGAGYKQLLSTTVCDELGRDSYMTAYIEEKAKTRLCSVATPERGCTDKEKEYLDKVKDLGADDLREQLAILQKTDSEGLKAKAKEWHGKRARILSELLEVRGEVRGEQPAEAGDAAGAAAEPAEKEEEEEEKASLI